MKPNFRADTYGVKTLRPGHTKVVAGRTPKQAYNAVYKLYKRHPEFRHREFDWKPTRNGVAVTRIQ